MRITKLREKLCIVTKFWTASAVKNISTSKKYQFTVVRRLDALTYTHMYVLYILVYTCVCVCGYVHLCVCVCVCVCEVKVSIQIDILASRCSSD